MTKQEELMKLINEMHIPAHLLNVNVSVYPLKDKVILSKVKHEQVTTGGIILAEMDRTNRPLGRIISMGPQCSETLKKGLTVIYDYGMGQPLLLNGIDYIMIGENFIDAVVADEKKVHIPSEGVTGADIKRAEKSDMVNRVRKDNVVKFDNHMDQYHEKLKDKVKNPVTSKYKKK